MNLRYRHYQFVRLSLRKVGFFVKGLKTLKGTEFRLIWQTFLDNNFSFRNLTASTLMNKFGHSKELKPISEVRFYSVVEPNLNEFSYVPALSNKFTMYKFIPGNFTVPLVAHYTNNTFYIGFNKVSSLDEFIAYLKEFESLIIKPSSEHGGGRGVSRLTHQNMDNTVSQFLSARQEFIVQVALVQSDRLSQLYPKSVNTVRVMSYRNQGKVELVSKILRLGIVDLVDNGGLSVGIDETGCLRNFGVAIKENFNKYSEHPVTKAKFEGKHIVDMDSLQSLIEVAHSHLPSFDLVSWDIAIDNNNKLVIIEFNVEHQEINFHQVCNGPLGEFFEKILTERNVL